MAKRGGRTIVDRYPGEVPPAPAPPEDRDVTPPKPKAKPSPPPKGTRYETGELPAKPPEGEPPSYVKVEPAKPPKREPPSAAHRIAGPSRQAQLRAQYEAELKRPQWQQFIFGPTVAKDENDRYYPVYTTEPPLVAPGRVPRLTPAQSAKFWLIIKNAFKLKRPPVKPSDLKYVVTHPRDAAIRQSLAISQANAQRLKAALAAQKAAQPKVLFMGKYVPLIEVFDAMQPSQKIVFTTNPKPKPKENTVFITVPMIDPSIVQTPGTLPKPTPAPRTLEEPTTTPMPAPKQLKPTEPSGEPTTGPTGKPATGTAPVQLPAPAPKPQPLPQPKPPQPPQEPLIPPKIPPKLPLKPKITPGRLFVPAGLPLAKPEPNAPDEEKREYLEKVEGFVARRRGALGGKSVWRVNFYPYGPKDEFTIVGAAPKGAKLATGTGSVSRSATLLKGVPPKKPIYSDTGAVDDVITARGNKIIITSVKDRGRRKLEA